MARIHAHRRGKSHSMRPTSKRVPSWVTYSADEVATLVVKMGKGGLTPSEVGLKLRDQYGIPLVKPLVGKSISRILDENKLRPSVPEPLSRLLERAKRLQTHLATYKADRKNVASLELLEAKIHRLSKYYKKKALLPQDWKFKAAVAQLA